MTTTAKKGGGMTDWKAEIFSVPGIALIVSFVTAFVGWRGAVAWRAAVLDRAVKDIEQARANLTKMHADLLQSERLEAVTDRSVASQLATIEATMRGLTTQMNALEHRLRNLEGKR